MRFVELAVAATLSQSSICRVVSVTMTADVYAFGIILWEILTRQEPYEDKEPMQIVVEVVNDDLRPEIPPEYKDNAIVPLMKDCWSARELDDCAVACVS